jgi:hypothetical protein
MQYHLYENAQGQLVFPAPPAPTIAVGNVDSTGQVVQGDASGQMPVVEQNSATISSRLGTNNDYHAAKPLVFDAAGNIAADTGAPWEPIPSVVGGGAVITADGAGNIGVEAEVIAAPGVATEALDVYMICQVSTTGAYQTQWGQDATGTLAPTTPDYHTANHSAYMVAGYPYILRMRTVTDNVNIGYGAGTNGEWPNSAVMYITGYWRGV